MIKMLTGAIEALDIGDPFDFGTDIGPVIDETAQDALEAHKLRMQSAGQELIDKRLPNECRAGTYVTPAAYEIASLDVLDHETLVGRWDPRVMAALKVLVGTLR